MMLVHWPPDWLPGPSWVSVFLLWPLTSPPPLLVPGPPPPWPRPWPRQWPRQWPPPWLTTPCSRWPWPRLISSKSTRCLLDCKYRFYRRCLGDQEERRSQYQKTWKMVNLGSWLFNNDIYIIFFQENTSSGEREITWLQRSLGTSARWKQIFFIFILFFYSYYLLF